MPPQLWRHGTNSIVYTADSGVSIDNGELVDEPGDTFGTSC